MVGLQKIKQLVITANRILSILWDINAFSIQSSLFQGKRDISAVHTTSISQIRKLFFRVTLGFQLNPIFDCDVKYHLPPLICTPADPCLTRAQTVSGGCTLNLPWPVLAVDDISCSRPTLPKHVQKMKSGIFYKCY